MSLSFNNLRKNNPVRFFGFQRCFPLHLPRLRVDCLASLTGGFFMLMRLIAGTIGIRAVRPARL